MTLQNEQQASSLQGHLPECEAYRNEVGGGCICHHVRACEERVRMEDDDYAYVAAQAEADGRWRGWVEGLEAARAAVAKEAERGPLYSVRNSGDAQQGWDAMSRHALAAIDALREEKPPPLPPSVGVPTTPMWPAQ